MMDSSAVDADGAADFVADGSAAPHEPADASISQESALEYWNTIPANVDGMLGGIPQVTRIDLQSSANFLAKLRRQRNTRSSTADPPPRLLSRAVDCGAGIGRITKGLLINHASTVDIVEPVEKFAGAVAAELGADRASLGKIYTVGLEAWEPETAYDLFWNQWCLGQLTDAQLVAYLERCIPHLNEGGWIIVKENLSTYPAGQDVYDDVDSSVTRADGKFRALFQQAGLKIVATELQKGFPRDLFPVRTYALQPV